MILRLVAVVAFLIAGFIRSPFLPLEITNVPAHELFFAVLGAAQISWALFFLWRGGGTWIGLLLSGSSAVVMVVANLINVPFTNTISQPSTLLLIAASMDILAFLALLLHRGELPPTVPIAVLASVSIGGAIWGAALLAEPYFPDLAHGTVDQFERFDDTIDGEYSWNLPTGFPVPDVPEDNPMTAEKVELGRYLFYDIRLSGNGTMSCASCHHQEKAFADGLALPVGSTGESHVRNSQTLANAAYNATYTWANPILTDIEDQVVIPLFGEFPVEMGVTGNEDAVLARLNDDEQYQGLFAAAFPDEEQSVTFRNVVLSLSSFVRTMISGNSPYDQFVYQGDQTALSESALRGMDLFLSERFECHHCHGGFNFTLSTEHANTTFAERPFFNTGLYNVDDEGGYPRGNTGIFEITGNPDDMGRFRPPTLRNIELTAPYMHDGSIATLDEVIQFYADGGRDIPAGPYAGDGRENPFKSGFVPGFDITEQEREDLLNFLHSLTDEEFISDPAYANPFGT